MDVSHLNRTYLLTYLPQQPDRNLPDEGDTKI